MAEQLTLDAHPMARDLEDQIRDMRALQHFMLTHPDLEVSYVSGRTLIVSTQWVTDADGVIDYDQIDTAGVARQVRIMKDGGKVEKQSSDEYMTYRRRIGKAARIELTVSRKAVCVAREVGERVVVTEAVPRSERVEKIIEWDCAPILAQAEIDDTEADRLEDQHIDGRDF